MTPSLRDLLALRSLLGEFTAKGRGNETFEKLSVFGSMARSEFDRAGGIAGIGALISDLNGPDPQPPKAPPRRSPATPPLTGVPLGLGRASATARVARDASAPAGFESGDVLVCQAASGDLGTWVGQLGALVIETGAASSATVRVARERGVPVVRIHNARTLIPDRSHVVVDGRAGTVSVIQGHAAPA